MLYLITALHGDFQLPTSFRCNSLCDRQTDRQT